MIEYIFVASKDIDICKQPAMHYQTIPPVGVFKKGMEVGWWRSYLPKQIAISVLQDDGSWTSGWIVTKDLILKGTEDNV